VARKYSYTINDMGYYKIYHGIVYIGIVSAETMHEAKQRGIAMFSHKVKDFNEKFVKAVKMY
jgi:hypothetical protein